MPRSEMPSLGTQASHAAATVMVRVFHTALPWAMWIIVTFAGVTIRIVGAGMIPTVMALTAATGAGIAAADWHLRRHRLTRMGRWIGAATILAATGMTTAWLDVGTHRLIVVVYMFTGAAACLLWSLWLAYGDHHDLGRAFVPAAEQALGAEGARLFNVRREKTGATKAGRPVTVTKAGLQLPRGEVTTTEAAARVEHLEGALGYAPGSWAISADRADAGQAEIIIADPDLLDEAPLPWPGPSAPGQTVAEPFRVGIWADGPCVNHHRVPVGHTKAMGKTGAGKTESWAWNEIAEGITRTDYAALAVDITKGEQFFGPLRPALHWLATDPDDATAFLKGVHRCVRARTDYLGRHGYTVWEPGCGLTFLDIWLEEAPDIIALMETAKSRETPDVMMLRDWVSDLRSARSAGIAWNQLYQRTSHDQVPVTARAQQGSLCFGVTDKEDAQFGLSAQQQDLGARPELWGDQIPGKAYWDGPGIPRNRIAVPLRFYYWGPGSHRIRDYAEQWPKEARPLDPVTDEALNSVPVNKHATGKTPDTAKKWLEQGLTVLRAQLDIWRAHGKTTFTPKDLILAAEKTGHKASWLTGNGRSPSALDRLAAEGLIRRSGNNRAWIINPAPTTDEDTH